MRGQNSRLSADFPNLVKSVTDVLAFLKPLLIVRSQPGKPIGGHVVNGGSENDIDGGMIGDGAMSGESEIIDHLAGSRGERVRLEGVEDGERDRGENADDRNDREQFEQRERAIFSSSFHKISCYFQLPMLSLLAPAFDREAGSTILSGPADQIMTFPLWEKLFPAPLGSFEFINPS